MTVKNANQNKAPSLPAEESPLPDQAELRRLAEEIIREKAALSPDNLGALKPEAARELVHELLVHQIELKMQNEELRRAQVELDASRARYFDLYDLAPVGYITMNEKGLIQAANLTVATMLDVARAALIKQPLTRFILPEDQDLFYLHLKALFDTGKPHVCELRLLRPDGTQFWARLDAAMGGAEEGSGPEVRCTMSDITERKQAEGALRESEERHRIILQTSMDGFWRTDLQGRLLEVNETYCRMSGYSKPELLAMHISDLEVVETADDVAAHIRKIMAEGMTRFETRHRRKDGSILKVEVSVKYQPIEDGWLMTFLRDITEQRKLEDQFRQAQKMESIGRLAGGVAHDFNNMLTIIIGYGEIAIGKLGDDNPICQDIKEVVQAGRRSADLTRQLLAFSRQQTIKPQAVDLNELIECTKKMLKRLVGEDIDLRFVPRDNLWPTHIDPTQIDQILANLTVNSRDAIAGVGSILIETDNVVVDEASYVGHEWFTPGEYVKLVFNDSGSGMDEETMQKIFEPFFTTKEEDKGTGLGLSTVYGAVKQNHGFINVDSEPGHGSSFQLYFPRHHSSAEKQVEKQVEFAQGGSETILLVEDNLSILAMCKKILEKQGYTILAASQTGDALMLCEHFTDQIHLLVTDVIMPGMSGRELQGRVSSLKPGIKVLYMSGHAADKISREGVLDKRMHFIQKPFSLEDFFLKIRQVLDQKEES